VAAQKGKREGFRQVLAASVFILPNILGFAVFTAGPVLYSFVMSFTNESVLRTVPFRFVGFENYLSILGDKTFWLYFVNTVYFMLGIPVSILLSLGLAVLLNQKLKGILAFRTLLYLPTFVAGVAVLLLWKNLFNPEHGAINAFLDWAGQSLGMSGYELPRWLSSTKNIFGLDVESVGFNPKQLGIGAREAILLMGLIGGMGGGNMLLYLAALTNVPEELLEAAQLDGASPWKRFWKVTWPQLAPTTFLIVVLSVIGGFQGGFESARILTGGGPSGTTTTLAYYIYQKAFQEYQIGYASAVAWFLFAIIFTLTLINWKIGAKQEAI
jgi:multiple sugar transport system permease protein